MSQQTTLNVQPPQIRCIDAGLKLQTLAEIDPTKDRRKLEGKSMFYWPLVSANLMLRHQAVFGDRRRDLPGLILTLARNASF